MARKLKSDRVLFLTTLLLVGLSVVMVYSASAVVGLERFGKPHVFLIKQGMWAALGMGILAIVMRVDYRTYREPVFIWTCLGVVVLALVAVLFSPPVNNARRWFGVAGIGVQPSELAKLAAIFFIAALLERRMHRIDDVKYALAPIGLVVVGLVSLILLEPDFGTSMALALIAAVMVFAAGLNYRYIAGALLVGAADGLHHRHGRAVSTTTDARLPEPVGGPARRRVSDHPVAHRGRHRRHLGARPDERRPEAVLPARAAHRLHLLRHLRGAGADRRDRRAPLLLRHHLARPARRAARAGQLRRVPRARA